MKIWTIAACALALTACASTNASYNSKLAVEGVEYDAVCKVSEEQIDVHLDTKGNPVSDIELILKDGSIVRPRAVVDRRGRELPMQFASDFPGMGDGNGEATLDVLDQPARLVAQFTRDENFPGPRQLVLTSASGNAETILLASVKASNLNAPFSNFGYSREDRTYPDGDVETLFIRYGEDDTRIELSQAEYEATVQPSIQRLFATLPRTAQELQKCPEITAFFAQLFEDGYTYDGPSSNKAEGNSFADTNFYANPSRIVYYSDEGKEQRVEDPLSTLTLLMLGAINSRDNDQVERLYESARASEITGPEFVRAEASRKARNLRSAVQMVNNTSNCIDIEGWRKQKYGHFYKLYSDWVAKAEEGTESEDAVIHNLAGRLMNSVSKKNRAANGKPLSYSRRLEQIYRELVMEFDGDQ